MFERFDANYSSTTYKSGTVYPYSLCVPKQNDKADYALLVTLDGLNEAEASVMNNLVAEGVVPPCIVLGITAGTMPPTNAFGKERNMRMNDYDRFTSEYADFLIDEMIPALCKLYHLTLSASPELHMISGGSSGGIAAWSAAWFRNDYFRRVYMSSPTFSAMNNGNSAPVLIRKCETKPIRAFMDYSENEPDDYFGSSYCAALEGKLALEFAGYDFICEYHAGEGHCSRFRDEIYAEKVMRFLWKNWDTQPITAPRLSPRADRLISKDDEWEQTSEPFPEKLPAVIPSGEYRFDSKNIYFISGNTRIKAADGFENITSLALSSDMWRLYISDKTKGCIYAMSVCEDGTLKDKKALSALHIMTEFSWPGAYDLCVDASDHVYAATEMGIQAIRSFGLVDVIVPLPNLAIPLRLTFGGEGKGWLYAQAEGRVYRRKWKIPGRPDALTATEPCFSHYYD